MNRRHFLIALALVVPLALFGAAKIAASWRPIKIGALLQAQKTPTLPLIVASQTVVFAGDQDATITRFDLSSGRRTKRAIEGVCQGGRALWRLNDGKLEIIRPNQTRAYSLSPLMTLKLQNAARFDFAAGGVFLSFVKVLDGPEQLQLLAGERFCQWSQRTGQLEREFAYTDFDAGEHNALTRDGQSIVLAVYEVATYSTRDGRLTKRLKWDAKNGGQQQTSPFGAYSVYRETLANQQQWIMMDTHTGQRLWSVDWDVKRDLVFFSPDETILAIARPTFGAWHLHQTRDGVLIRTLPLVPEAVAGAFAPDNQTLYSLADGGLYRQRAR